MPLSRLCWAFAFTLGVGAIATANEGVDFFEKKIRPLFVEHCHSCHSIAAKKEMGGLRLDTPDAIRKGGDSGEVVKGAGDGSLLLQAVLHADGAPAMPPKGKLPATAIADLKKWIELGAPMPASAPPMVAIPAVPTAHWAFQNATEKAVPKVSDANWPKAKADYFVLKLLDEKALKPAPEADRRTLARRVSFDLIGLSPTVEQVESFVQDLRPDAYERLVDSLLASPRFGEKWGRHWLDVARYAEEHSTSESTCKPPRYPHRYRDWIIAAFNDDVPFDRFVQLQLAADLLPKTAPPDYAALGFLGLSPVYHKEPKLSKDVIAAFVADEWDERVDAITRGFLGLTVACARCHDHKFDPISTKDYYALAGVLANTQLAERPIKPDADAAQDALTTVRLQLLDTNLRGSYAKEMKETAIKEKRDPRPFAQAQAMFERMSAELKLKEKALETGGAALNVVRDAGTWVNGNDPAWTTIDYKPGQFRDLPVFIRGEVTRPGPIVPRRFLTVLSKSEPKPFRHGSGRRELAEAILTEAASLTSRVYVNRVWGWVFGRGIVTTPSNFGLLGDKPTHPELLDDLAARFIANRWSTKWLVKELVTSATYRQASTHDDKATALDSDNALLWRAPRKRLEVEQWRDTILQVSGQLNLNGGGPSDNLDSPQSVRRTVYGKVSRDRLSDVHRLFDLPDPKFHGEKREATITPVQQLYFLNSPFVRQASAALARVAAGQSVEDGTSLLFRKVYLREPTPAELDTARALLKPAKPADKPAWELLAQVLLASNEFLFVN